MELAGIRRTVNTTLTGDDHLGLRRSKPLSTSLATSIKPRITSLAKLPPNTHVSSPDLATALKKIQTGSQHERLVKQTRKWVSQTFFGTLLKQMRESPFKSDLLDG